MVDDRLVEEGVNLRNTICRNCQTKGLLTSGISFKAGWMRGSSSIKRRCLMLIRSWKTGAVKACLAGSDSPTSGWAVVPSKRPGYLRSVW